MGGIGERRERPKGLSGNLLALLKPNKDVFQIGASLNIRRAEDREKIFRQMKQNSARVVYPTRRDFVKYHGKYSAEISCDEFLEVPICYTRVWACSS